MTNSYRDLLKQPELRREYERERLFESAVSDIEGLLHDRRLTQAEIARRLDISEGRVSQLLSGRRNLTLKTLSDLAWALGLRVELTFDQIEDLASTPASGDEPVIPQWMRRRTALWPMDDRLGSEVRVSAIWEFREHIAASIDLLMTSVRYTHDSDNLTRTQEESTIAA